VSERTRFLGMSLNSPVLVASGPASHDVNQVQLAAEHGAGGIVLKTACSEKYNHMRYWPRPRYKLLDWDKQIGGRSKHFSLYSYEQGYSGTLGDYWEFIERCKEQSSIPVIGSIFADEARDWALLATQVERHHADAIELDISSPHRPGSLEFETTFIAAIRAVVEAVSIPVIVKLGPGPDIVRQSVAAERAGAAGLTLCNRTRGLDVDVESQRPILHGYFAGIGGPWSRFIVMRHLAEVAPEVGIPISASGGVMTGEDIIKFVLLGATTVQVLSVIMVNGWESLGRINAEIAAYMNTKGITSLDQIRGRVLERMTAPDDIIRWSGEPVGGPRNVRK